MTDFVEIGLGMCLDHDIFFAILLIVIGYLAFFALTRCKIETQTRLYLSSVVCFFIGLCFIIISVILKDHPIRSSIYLALGTILIFSIAYTVYTEYRLFSNIIAKIEDTINKKIPINASIVDYGLSKIEKFDGDMLLNSIKNCHSCKYIVLYSLNFLKNHYRELEDFVEHHELHIVMTDYESINTIKSLEDSFEPRGTDEVKQHIKCSKKYVCEYICKKGSHRSHVKISLVDRVLTYSSYIFDDREFWLCPRQSTKSKKDGVVFVFKNNLKNNFYYNDSIEVINNAQLCCNSCEYEAQ